MRRQKNTIRQTAVGMVLATFFLASCIQQQSSSTNSAATSSDSSGDVVETSGPQGDYGDAPASFPTKASNDGARHLNTTRSALGWFLADGSLPVSAELDATDPNDPDGEPNLGPDQDHYDDGFLVGLLPVNGTYEFPVVVSVDAGAEDKPRYVNLLADWNQDLDWNGEDADDADEWVVQNYEVHVTPGTAERILLPAAKIGSQMYNTWFRVTLSEKPVTAGPNGWDGTGEFEEGETEDYIYVSIPHNEIIIDDDDVPPPPPPDVPEDGSGDGDDPADDDGADDGNGDDGGDGGFDRDDPDGDGQPGVDPNNVRKLRRQVANVYSLILCVGDTWSRGFEWETHVRNGQTSNPFVAGLGLSNDPGTVTISARDVGHSQVTFEANTISFPVETVEWVTGIINVTVIPCDHGEPLNDGGGVDGDSDGDGADDDPWSGADPEDSGKLRHAQGNEYYLVLCLCEEIYTRGFQYETRVYNPSSSDPTVASLSVGNDPGRITIRPQAVGETTLTFDADPATFPYDDSNRDRITIHVKVIDCTEYYMMQELGQ